MGIIRSIIVKLNQSICLARGVIFALRVRAWGGYAGPKIMMERGVKLRHEPGSKWNIEDRVYIGLGVILDVQPGGELRIGSGTKIMHNVLIGVQESIRIGRDVQIAECCSIRDADHQIDTAGLISRSPMISKPLLIGDNAWVGRGCAVIAGATLGNGVVVAANSVVKGPFPDDALIAGAPAQFKRLRITSDKEVGNRK